MPTSLVREWADFSVQVMSPDAPPVQYEEMRMAFYAGALAALNGCLIEEEGGNRIGLRQFSRLREEACDFLRSDIRRLEVRKAAELKGDNA